MTPEELSSLVREGFDGDRVEASGEGGKYQVTVVSDRFDGLNTLKRHQLVYATVRDHIDSGEIHALTIVARTTGEEES